VVQPSEGSLTEWRTFVAMVSGGILAVTDHKKEEDQMHHARQLRVALATIALLMMSTNVSNAVPQNFTIQFDDASLPGSINWTGSYTVESSTGLLTNFEAMICRPVAPLDCDFNTLGPPSNDDPDDNDNLLTAVVTPAHSAQLLLKDGTTNEWQILDPFGSLTHGTYGTTRVPMPRSALLYLVGILSILLVRHRSAAHERESVAPAHPGAATGASTQTG
jgi:hypothetical protein